MDDILQDLRYAIRSLRRTPGFTFTVVAVLALGIGANALIYSVLRGILFASLPFPEADRIVQLRAQDTRQSEDMSMSLADLRDVMAETKSIDHVTPVLETNVIVNAGGEAKRYEAAVAASGLPAVLGVQPALGRWFTQEECRTGPHLTVTVLGDRAWREQFGGSRDVIGKTVRMSGRTREVVGVMPPGFRFPEKADFYVPFAVDDTANSRGAHFIDSYARIAPAASLAQANAELGTLSKRLAEDFPSTNLHHTFLAKEYRSGLVENIQSVLWMLTLAVTFVLLIACANVANLLLARAATRTREVGVRVALGASRGRLIRQMLTESLLLSLMGGALGLFLGSWGLRVVLASIPIELPFWMQISIDWRVALAVAGVAMISGVGFGLAPALQISSGDILTPIREGTPGGGDTPGRRRTRSALVVAEISLAVVLLIGSGLMVRTFLKQMEQRSTLRTDGAVTGVVALPSALFADDAARTTFVDDFGAALRGIPGVQAAGGVLNLHLANNRWTMSIQREGKDSDANEKSDHPVVSFNVMTPGYLDAVGLPIQKGRDFEDSDRQGAPSVAIINESAARFLWPGEDPIGKRWRLGGDDPRGWFTVVGVIPDVRQNIKMGGNRLAEVIVPHSQWSASTLRWVIRSSDRPAGVVAAVRQALRTRSADLVFADARTLDANVRHFLWEPRLYAQLMGAFSLVALVIAALGIHGVMAYTVAQRTREIGIRMALGAARADVQRLVVGQALRLTLIGAGIGLALAFWLTRYMQSQLLGVRPDDPPTFVGVTLILALSSVVAAWIPTARAVRVDPVVALRHE